MECSKFSFFFFSAGDICLTFDCFERCVGRDCEKEFFCRSSKLGQTGRKRGGFANLILQKKKKLRSGAKINLC